jgi:Transmembrane secretion effector
MSEELCYTLFIIIQQRSGVSDTHDPYQALRFSGFRLLLIGLFIAGLGEKMIDVAIGWELYERTGSALVLGGVGLALVIPVLLLSLPAGHLIDRFNRKYIVIISQIVLALVSLGLTALSFTRGSLVLIYGCLVLYGCAAAFNSPAASTLVPQVVAENAFENAATWDSSVGQLSSVLGPALGGLLIAVLGGATLVYAINAGVILVFVCLLFFLREIRQAAPRHETTTLLPIYAKTILHVGPAGLGWLRAAPALGALCMSFAIAHMPPFKRAGRTLLLAVTGFGVATIVFGISHSFWLSLLMLALLGGFDNISVVIRSTLLMTRTPDALLGRISAINFIFIGASNELGGFESGLVAQFFGPVIAVAGGGIGTVLVVLLVALLWPEMRRLGAMSAGV